MKQRSAKVLFRGGGGYAPSRVLGGGERRFRAGNIITLFTIHLTWHLWDNHVAFRIRIVHEVLMHVSLHLDKNLLGCEIRKTGKSTSKISTDACQFSPGFEPGTQLNSAEIQLQYVISIDQSND